MSARLAMAALWKCVGVAAAMVIAVGGVPAFAGGPQSLVNQRPVVYPNGGSSLTVNLDQGPLGARTNTQAVAIVGNAIALWNGVGTSTLRLAIGAPLVTDYTAANYGSVMGNTSDGLNPVIFDTDGSITDAVFGTGQKNYFLGFAGSAYFTQGTAAGLFLEGYAILNGSIPLTDDHLLVVATHEIGHLVGLDHAQLDNTHGLTADNFVLMYPVIYRTRPSLHEDDAAAITALYPAATADAYYGQVQGTFTTTSGAPIIGANIWAREESSGQVYSVVSDFLMQGNGYFRMRLPAGNYTLHAESINAGFKGASSVGPYAEAAGDASFQAPHPLVPIVLGGGTPRLVAVTAGCTALVSFALDGAGNVAGNCSASGSVGATIVANPYGVLDVQGATLNGNTISNLQANAVIQLGSMPGTTGSMAELDFNGLQIAAGSTLTIRAGAAGQTVYLRNVDGSASAIAGTLSTAANATTDAPALVLHNASGITIVAGGRVIATSGLTIDTLGSDATTGAALVNEGAIDGGVSLDLSSSAITGSGTFTANTIVLSTFGNANNPVHGNHYLANGLQIYPSTGTAVALTLNAYGTRPQVLNLMVNGNTSIWMPSAWPTGSPLRQNNPTAAPASTIASATPDPAYGGGSLLAQATGTMTLFSGPTNDFIFPGGIVFKAGISLDVNGVTVNNGWTASGRAFQGVFFEASSIVNRGNLNVLTNNLNWVNFSSPPQAPVRTWQLAANADASRGFVSADTVAPHLNTFSTITEAAAGGQCYVCVMNPDPVPMY